MPKPQAPRSAAAAAPSPAPASPAEAHQPRPTTGGCYVRLPDGTLAPDPSTDTPEQAPETPAQE
jgi:hypothetical protein